MKKYKCDAPLTHHYTTYTHYTRSTIHDTHTHTPTHAPLHRTPDPAPMTLSKSARPWSTLAKTPKQLRLEALYTRERQRLDAERASLSPEDRALFDVVYAQFNLDNRRNQRAQAVIHCPIGTCLLQTECHNNMQRAWYFLTDADTGEVWCIFILASTHYLNRAPGSPGAGSASASNEQGTDHARILADTVIRHARNQRADVDLADRVQAHLMARRPLKVFCRCQDNEMKAIAYGRAVGEGSAFVQTTTYASVAALGQAYPVLAKPAHARRAQSAVGHPQVRLDLEVRTTPWATTSTAPVPTVSSAGVADGATTAETDWPTFLAVQSAAK